MRIERFASSVIQLNLDEPSDLTEYERRAAEYEQHLTEYERHRGLQMNCGSGQAPCARNAKRRDDLTESEFC